MSGTVATGLTDKPVVSQKVTVEDMESVYHGKLEAGKEDLYGACQGFFDEHHVYMLKLIRQEIESTQKTIVELNKEHLTDSALLFSTCLRTSAHP
jgi:hypothetical protein